MLKIVISKKKKENYFTSLLRVNVLAWLVACWKAIVDCLLVSVEDFSLSVTIQVLYGPNYIPNL